MGVNRAVAYIYQEQEKRCGVNRCGKSGQKTSRSKNPRRKMSQGRKLKNTETEESKKNLGTGGENLP